MRPHPNSRRGAVVPRRRRRERHLPGARQLRAAWAFLMRLRKRHLRLPAGLGQRLSSVSLPLPTFPSFPRFHSLYDLVAWLRPGTRRCLVGLLVTALIALSTWLFILSPRGTIARTGVEKMIATSAERHAALAQQHREMQEEIARLENDPEMIEIMARNELNMAFPGESIYRPIEKMPPAYVLNYQPRTDARP